MHIKEKINELLQKKESNYVLALFNNFSVFDAFTEDVIIQTLEEHFSDSDIKVQGFLSFRKGEAVLEVVSVSNLLKINIFDFESYARSKDKILHLKEI